MKKLFAAALMLLPGSGVLAQPCSQVYTFNINDKSSYSTSCGYQDGNDWKVVKNSCNFYTPLTTVGGKPGDAKKVVDIRVRMSNSGNLDENDFAWIFYYINGKAQSTKTLRGSEIEQNYQFRDSILVPAGGTFKMRIAYVCDEQDEFWKISNGDLTTCVRGKGEARLDAEPPVIVGKISFVREREIVKLVWNSPSGPMGNYFKIERSKDGKEYEFAGYVKDNRSGSALSQYSFIDGGCYKPQTWYRISQVDMEGNSQPFGSPDVIKF
jgi:hypothetical protein